MILVTGGAGFIGSHIVDQLVAGGHEVRVVDSLHPAAHEQRPAYLNPEAEYRWGDLADPECAEAAVAGCAAVSHQASMVGLGVDFGDVEAYCRNNDLGTAGLLGALHRTGFAGPIVLAGSMVVYGEGGYRCGVHGPVRPRPRSSEQLEAGRWEPDCPDCGGPLAAVPVDEDAPVDPRNVYAATKLHQEHLARSFEGEHRGAPVTALRYHNVYGPRMPHDTPYAGVASIFRGALERGAAPEVFEDGGQRRDFIHVQDVARANVLALAAAESGVFNVASGHPQTVLEMASSLSEAFGPAAPQPRVVGGYRAGDVRHVFASPARAEARLRFSATTGFAAGMVEFADAELR